MIRPPFIAALLACALFSGPSGALDYPNRDFRVITGVDGKPARADDLYSFASGNYACTNESTRATPHIVRYPFNLPANSSIRYVSIYGRRTSDATPMSLRLMQVCQSPGDTDSTSTELATRTPDGNADGYFISVMSLDSELVSSTCRAWVEARFDISTKACDASKAWIQRVLIETQPTDRIFRGTFSTHVDYTVP